MNLYFLPKAILLALEKYDIKDVCEIRMRVGYPIKIVLKDKHIINCALITCSQHDIDSVIEYITENSLYAFNDRINQGYITTRDGIRVGVVGECVFCKDKIIAVKNISSINIRIPHEINGCAKKIYEHVFLSNTVYNTLVISSAGYGKTTFLKDLIRKINDEYDKNILIIDERGEFCNVKGENIDTILYSNKSYAFDVALRSMAPHVVVTDELSDENDWLYAKKAVNSGVKIFASCHAESIDEVISKQEFKKNVFERYIVLRSCSEPGIVQGVFDKGLNKIL